MSKEFYNCGTDCDECPEFDNCLEEDCEYLEIMEEEEYYKYDDDSPDSLLDQEFEDRISGYDYEVYED